MQEDLSSDPMGGELGRLRAEKAELMRSMVLRQADFENYKKRIERDRQEESRRGVSRLLTDLIPVLDGYARALQAHADPAYEEYRKGLELIFRQLWDTLSKHGLERSKLPEKCSIRIFTRPSSRCRPAKFPMVRSSRCCRKAICFTGASCGPASCAWLLSRKARKERSRLQSATGQH